jgi:hypothetical protein
MSAFDDLFRVAEENLRKQEIPEDFGPLRQTEEGERLLTRFLGREVMPPFDDVVFRFLDYTTGEPFYLKSKAQLAAVLEKANIGDIVGLVRGKDKDIGKPHPMETWDGWVRPCDEPLGASKQPDSEPTGVDSDIPFLCPGERETRSVSVAAAATE